MNPHAPGTSSTAALGTDWRRRSRWPTYWAAEVARPAADLGCGHPRRLRRHHRLRWGAGLRRPPRPPPPPPPSVGGGMGIGIGAGAAGVVNDTTAEYGLCVVPSL